METKIHKWAKGARRPSGVSADDAARELERIRAEVGDLTPQAVLLHAADERAPLHTAFEWDDSKAGHEYRLNQARGLIRAVVTIELAEVPEHRSYVLVRADPAKEETSYLPTAEVVSRPDLFGDALRRLQSELKSARDSVNQMSSLADAINAASDRRERLRSVGERLDQAVLAAESV
jgi:prophage DNA circulation protein